MSEENNTDTKKTKTLSLTSNRPGGKTYSITLDNRIYWMLIMGICVLVGTVLGVLVFESRQVIQITDEIRNQKKAYEVLTEQYDALIIERDRLEEQVLVLSDTINTRILEDEVKAQKEAEERIPTGFPVTGSVKEAEPPEEANELEMAVYYESNTGSVVVATGVGEVFGVRQNVYGNYEIQIDHGNGYISIYTNEGTPLLEEGVQVSKGTPLFYIGDENVLTKYQITHEGALVDVYDVMNIDG